MSRHEEDVLRRVALRPPSEGLDERMGKLLAAPRVQPAGRLARPVQWWHVAVASVAGAAAGLTAGLLLHPPQEAPTRPMEVRYVLQAEPQAFNVFDWTQYPTKARPYSILKKNRTAEESGGRT